MSVVLIKNKHSPLAIFLIALAGFLTWHAVGAANLPEINQLLINVTDSSVTALLLFLPGLFLQYLENKFIWGKHLDLDDSISFYGVSVGICIGLLVRGFWIES